jgi:hypothetical protein
MAICDIVSAEICGRWDDAHRWKRGNGYIRLAEQIQGFEKAFWVLEKRWEVFAALRRHRRDK